MPIDLTSKIEALIAALSDDDLAAMRPAELHRLKHLCQGLVFRAGRIEAGPNGHRLPPKGGVLGALHDGARSE
jgi:hypothetical protein